jgi:malonate-semialdehyde dehydrogenase (acetylating)/methylmalonate-semialdehyde dehydrogenase
VAPRRFKGTSPVFNPSRGEIIAETPLGSPEIVDEAVQAAAAAFPAWMETPPTERARVLFRFKMLLEDHFEELARLGHTRAWKDARRVAR